MYFTASGMPIIEEEDDIAEISSSSTSTSSPSRPVSYWEGMPGLGIHGFEHYIETCALDRDPKPLSRRTSSRRSLVSTTSRSTDSQYSDRQSTDTAFTSYSSYECSPISTKMSSPLEAPSTDSMSCEPVETFPDDLTTYYANLARFRIERAERVAELGLSNWDSSETDFSRFMKIQAREVQNRKGSVRIISKGLRAYWGGSSSNSSPDIDELRGSHKSSVLSDPYWDAQADRAALKAWWDQLGN